MNNIIFPICLATIVLNIVILVFFFNLCSDVRRIKEFLCKEGDTKTPKPELIGSPFEVGQHVYGEGIELIIADRNGEYYKCNRADSHAFYKVLHHNQLSKVKP